MQRSRRISLGVAAGLLTLACIVAGYRVGHHGSTGAAGSDDPIRITLIHLSDLSDIAPSHGGSRGGLARVAALRRRLLGENPNTFVVLSGDFLSPSVMSNLRVDGEPFAGRQMIDVLNAMGLDYATFGGHEFDLPEESLRERIAESRFLWVSSNVYKAGGQSFPRVIPRDVLVVEDRRGRRVRVGWIGLTGLYRRPDFVRDDDPITAARREIQALEGRADIIIAVTHLPLQEDIALVHAVPEIDLVLGGHEHENLEVWRGSGPTLIAKSAANAASVHVHELAYLPAESSLQVQPHLVPITDALPEDPRTERTVKRWVDLAGDALREEGFDPRKVVAVLPRDLDARESVVRTTATEFTQLIADSVLHAAPGAVLAFFNAGSIRADDIVPAEVLTEDQIFGILPFGGRVVTVDVRGDVLKKVILQGESNRGTGGFLQTTGVSVENGEVRLNGDRLDLNHDYRVGVNDFLLTGREDGLDFFHPDHPGVTVVEEGLDLRLALIDELRKQFGSPEGLRRNPLADQRAGGAERTGPE